MAITAGDGQSRVLKNRRFEDYRSLKQYFSDRTIKEVFISGANTTVGALAEIDFAVGDIINYIGAEGQVYLRTELDDIANQNVKYCYIEYQDDTGAVRPILKGIMDNTNTTTEVAVAGATDFYRLRQMISEVEATATKGIVLTDADMAGANDIFGFINDGNSQFNLQRFFTQPNATCDSYLAHLDCHTAQSGVDANMDAFILTVQYTPRVLGVSDGFAEPQVAADKTLTIYFHNDMEEDPCILLEGGTEVIFSLGDVNDPATIHVEFVLVEVYPTNSTPSS